MAVKALAQERLLDLVASVGQARKPVTTAPTAAERGAEQNAPQAAQATAANTPRTIAIA